MNLNHHVAQLLLTYRAEFNTTFDPPAFRSDAFYASQVLDKSLRTGSPALQALAAPLEQLLLDTLYADPAADAALYDTRAWAALYHENGRDSALRHEAARHKAARNKSARHENERCTPRQTPPPAPAEKSASSETSEPRFADRDIFFIARLRLQYRRRFGTFFDIFEFTRNDLYARSLLMICAGSGDAALQTLAGRFSRHTGRALRHGSR
jgi:hypothetical protein